MHKRAHDPHRHSGKMSAPPSHYPHHSPARYSSVDAARGTAIVLMFVYHFMFDLHYYKIVTIDFNNDPVWLGLRTLIVGLFLGVMGISLHLATANGLNQRAYVRRLLQVAGCAALVSASSYMMFPKSMIFFGILHFIAAASVLGLLFYRGFLINLCAGVALIILGLTVQHPWFDQPGWQWIGLMTHKPITEDYVPLLPWFGVVLLGLFVGKWIFPSPPLNGLAGTLSGLSASLGKNLAQWQGKTRFSRLLAFGGRHSLPIYMLHQPVFLAVLYLFVGLGA